MQHETAELPLEGRYSLIDRVTTYDLGPVELHTALDRQLERQVAVQLLPASAPAEERARFLESQRIAAGIHHCGVVQVYDVGEWHGANFSVVEKDAAVRGGPSPAPDAGSALSVARQVAEALQCVRDAGLTEWVFAPAALRTGADGAPRLALLEGLDHDTRNRIARSATREDDGRALGTLLGMLIAGLPLAAVPPGVHDLIERATREGATLTAGDFAAEVSQLEQAAQQQTAAHPEARENAAVAYAAAAAVDPHDAPTLVAPVVPAVDAATVDVPAQPYEGPLMQPSSIRPAKDEQRRAGPLLPLAAAGLLLLLLLLFVAWPRSGAPTDVTDTAASAAESTPTTAAPTVAPTAAPTVVAVLVPEFVGTALSEAKDIASAAGLGLLVASAAHDPQYPADVILSQDPAPGSSLAPGSDVTLVLSLGPEPAPAPPAEGAGEDEGGNGGGDNGDGNGKKDNGRGKKKP